MHYPRFIIPLLIVPQVILNIASCNWPHTNSLQGNRALGDVFIFETPSEWMQIDTELDFCHHGHSNNEQKSSRKYSQKSIETEIIRLQKIMSTIPEVNRILFQFGGTHGAEVSFVDNLIARGVNGWMAGNGKILLNADLLFSEKYHLIVTYIHEIIHHYQFIGISDFLPQAWLYGVDLPIDFELFSENLFNLEAEAFYYGALVAKSLMEKVNYQPLGVYQVLTDLLIELEEDDICISDPEITAPKIFEALSHFFSTTNAYQNRWRRLFNKRAPDWGMEKVALCASPINYNKNQPKGLSTQVEIVDQMTGKFFSVKFEPIGLPYYFPLRTHQKNFQFPILELEIPLDPLIDFSEK